MVISTPPTLCYTTPCLSNDRLYCFLHVLHVEPSNEATGTIHSSARNKRRLRLDTLGRTDGDDGRQMDEQAALKGWGRRRARSQLVALLWAISFKSSTSRVMSPSLQQYHTGSGADEKAERSRCPCVLCSRQRMSNLL